MRHNPLFMARYYVDKYGSDVVEKLERDAAFCEDGDNLHHRNRLLRIRDLILQEGFESFVSTDEVRQWQLG